MGTGHGLILVGVLLSTTDPTSPSGGDQTDLGYCGERTIFRISIVYLLSGGGTTLDSGSLSNMLMVTTTMGMLHRIHGNTTHLKTGIDIDDNYSEFVKLLLCIHCWRGEIISSFQGD